MESVDLSLLPHLEALLETSSVTEAAKRQGLSPPAMSRTLARLREQTGDALLVRAGHRMVLTPQAMVLRAELPPALDQLRHLLAGAGSGRVQMTRPFRIRASDAVPSILGVPLLAALRTAVDGAALVFVPEGDEDVDALRSGAIDLDIGVQADDVGPELMVRGLFTDEMVAVAAVGHPILAAPVDHEAFCRWPHIAVSRRGVARGPVDRALEALGHAREVALVVGGYLDAAHLVAAGDFISLLPGQLACRVAPVLALTCFAPPMQLPPLRVALAWHPRMHEDPAHCALRAAILEVVGSETNESG